jgi:cytochrome c biogenesis protein ResB
MARGHFFAESSLHGQPLSFKGKSYELTRPRRFYKDFSLTLLDFRHASTAHGDSEEFSSQIRLENPRTGRIAKSTMNNPLRYQGLTFYQASFDKRDDQVTILQVVHNPAWLTPYFACLIVGFGLAVQFGIHLVGFLRKKVGSPAVAAPA